MGNPRVLTVLVAFVVLLGCSSDKKESSPAKDSVGTLDSTSDVPVSTDDTSAGADLRRTGQDLSDGADTVGPLAATCCGEGGECPQGTECVAGFLGGPPACLPELGVQGCWSNSDCGDAIGCKGVKGCPCDEPECDVEPALGNCGGCACCASDDDCADDLVCKGDTAEGQGLCVAPLGPDAEGCWEDDDCQEGESCKLTHATCTDLDCGLATAVPGTCKDDKQEAACCDPSAEPSECPDGAFCLPWDETMGKCAPLPGPGECYFQEECGDPNFIVCAGAKPCPCLQGCTPDAGHCEPVPWVTNCCYPGTPCDDDEVCVWDEEGEEGACLPALVEGKCWEPKHCGANAYCVGAVHCECGEECDFANAHGSCVTYSGICCTSDAQCPEGESCIQQPFSSEPGRCMHTPVENECWTKKDCPPDVPEQTLWECSDVYVCPCTEDCPDCPHGCFDFIGHCVGMTWI